MLVPVFAAMPGNAPVPSLGLILYIQDNAQEPSTAMASLPVSSI